MTDHNARQAGLEKAVHAKLLELIEKQSEGEWDAEMIASDARHFTNELLPILAAHSADARNVDGVALTDEQRDAIRHAIVILDHRENFGPNSPSRIASRVLTAILAAPAAPAPKDAEILQVIDERDAYHEMADDLAAQIAAITDVDIGEHSNLNDPWRNAMLAADDFIAKQLRKLLAGPSAPAPAAQGGEAHPQDALHYLQMGLENLALGNGVHTVDFSNLERVLQRMLTHQSGGADAASEADKKDAERLNWLIENVNCDEIDNLPALPWGLSLDDHFKAFRDAIDEALRRERQQGAQSNG